MQYQTLFDIQSAQPHCAWNLGSSLAILAFGLWLRWHRQRPFPATTWPWLAMGYAVLDVVKNGWKWIAGAGALFLLAALFSAVSGYREIQALRAAPKTWVIEGKVQRIGQWYSLYSSRAARYGNEALTVNGHPFTYRENAPGSPYPLSRGPHALKAGTSVRILTDGSHILRIEGPLCQVYPRCRVSEFGPYRYEQDLTDRPVSAKPG